MENEGEKIEQVFQELPIKEGPFTLNEYLGTLKEDKSFGEDGIVPYVQKWVPIDDLLPHTANKAPMNPVNE